MIKAALIDMDGVLYDSMPYHAKAWEKLAGEMGMPLSEEEFYQYEGMTGEATINKIAQRELGKVFPKEETDRLYARKAAYFQSFGEPRLMPGAAATLEYLKSRGITCVLVTGSGQTSLLEKLSSDYPGVFGADKMVTAKNVNHGKPHPEPYLKGAALAGVNPSECIAIDNAPLGVESAAKAGAFTIGVTTGPIPARMLLDAGASVVVDSMEGCRMFLTKNLSEL